MNKLIEIISGATVSAFLLWIIGSFLEIGFTNFASDLNAIKILLELI